ncbi:sugar transferase [Brevundimonas sp.]|jgi:lipopolysaccharide/colanic/teichoic acid biosynthesis glycosyltransferase|uniref:sugar transferase n=1 Tax=Brevundimonas sp. TaxID=1871086 RepID=UPI0028AE2678|nr:sugar transferase [Brevundimonas sp.]
MSDAALPLSNEKPALPRLAGGRDVRLGLALKRLMDIGISAVLLVALSPLLLAIAVLVKATSLGPALYGVDWVGQAGRRFRGYKFRTMGVDADRQEEALQSQNEMRGPAFKMENDPRITPLGRVLRRYSLDEFPQLWSVLKGDLSLVGPRPPRVHEYERFTPFQMSKMAVKPGITCLWQVEGRHRINDFDEWVRLDIRYIETWSLGLDVWILIRTAGVVLRGTGA